MANEITIQAMLNVQRSTLSLQGAGSQPCSPAGTKAASNQLSISTSGWTAITLIDTGTNCGYMFLKNIDSTNFVQLALDNAGAQIFAKIRANEFCLLPLKDSTTQIWAQANTAAVSVIVVAAQA